MLIQKYIYKNLNYMLISFTLIPTIIIWIAQTRGVIDLIINNGISFWIFFKLSLLVIPPLMPHLLPFTFIFSVLYLLYKMYNDNELTVLWASGITVPKMMMPFLIQSIIVSILIFGIYMWIAPASSQKLKQEIFNVKSDLARSLLKSSVFISPTDTLKIYIHDIDYGSQINGFFLIDNSDKNIKRIFTAEKALIVKDEQDNKILLKHGQILLHNKSKNEKPSLLEFDKFTFDLNALEEKINAAPSVRAKDYSVTQFIKQRHILSDIDYNHFIRQFHIHLTSALSPIIYMFIVTIGFIRPIQPRFFPFKRIFTVITLIILVKIGMTYCEDSVEHGKINLLYLYVLPIIAVITNIIYILSTQKSARG